MILKAPGPLEKIDDRPGGIGGGLVQPSFGSGEHLIEEMVIRRGHLPLHAVGPIPGKGQKKLFQRPQDRFLVQPQQVSSLLDQRIDFSGEVYPDHPKLRLAHALRNGQGLTGELIVGLA